MPYYIIQVLTQNLPLHAKMIYMTEEEARYHVLVDEANRLSKVLGTSNSIAADSKALSNAEFIQYFDIYRWYESGCKESSKEAIMCYLS